MRYYFYSTAKCLTSLLIGGKDKLMRQVLMKHCRRRRQAKFPVTVASATDSNRAFMHFSKICSFVQRNLNCIKILKLLLQSSSEIVTPSRLIKHQT